jgi:hypothetical protein
MFPVTAPPLVAGGNVSPCRFVKISTTAGQGVQAAAGTDLLVGISIEETRYPPNSPADDGLVAIANENLPYLGPGQVTNLIINATLTAGVVVTADASGKGIAPAAGDYVGAILLQGGVAGDKVMAYILPPGIKN